MRSRNRPALGQKPSAANANVEKHSTTGKNSVCDEMLSEVNEMTDTTPESLSHNRDMDHMSFKLHTVLKDLLKRNNESARAAAKACGIPLSTFSGYLKPDKHQIDPNHLLAIAKHYDVSVDYLLSGKESKQESFKNIPTKKLFSRWVKLTIEDLADVEDSLEQKKGGEK